MVRNPKAYITILHPKKTGLTMSIADMKWAMHIGRFVFCIVNTPYRKEKRTYSDFIVRHDEQGEKDESEY